MSVLLDKYLPVYDFSEKHAITISSSPARIFALIDELDLSESRLIKFLFRLRAMPSRMLNKEGMRRSKFIELEKFRDRELIIGLIGQFWKPFGNLQSFRPDEFKTFNTSGYARAVWNFQITVMSAITTRLETETRVQCMDQITRRKFSFYWFFIRPFSGIIRKEILRLIKKKAETTPGTLAG